MSKPPEAIDAIRIEMKRKAGVVTAHLTNFNDYASTICGVWKTEREILIQLQDQQTWAVKKLSHALNVSEESRPTLERLVELACERIK